MSRTAKQAQPALSARRYRELASGKFEFKEVQSLFTESVDVFKLRWFVGVDDVRQVQRRCREMAETKPNPFVQWLIRMHVTFYNRDFQVTTDGDLDKTQKWLDAHANYPFKKLSRAIWREYEICSSVVAFWRENSESFPDTTRIDGLPQITIFDCERTRYQNDFGVESVFVTPERRKLSKIEKAALGPRYADAIENGTELQLDPKLGERFKVLTTAKVSSGFGMPRWKAAFDDLAILDLLKIGDWNGAWARRKLVRHTAKGHEISQGPQQGSPTFFLDVKYAKKLLDTLNKSNGYSELITNFDQVMKYMYVDPEFFDPKVYESVELRLDRYAGAVGMMMRESTTPSPYLMPVFRAEGLEERDVVGSFIEEIMNDPTFYGKAAPPSRLLATWDPTIFLNEKMLMSWFAFAYSNGIASPQTMRRYMNFQAKSESELIRDAKAHREDYEPVFEPKQGLLQDNGDGTGTAPGGDGRPTK